MKRFYVFKDGVQQGSTATKESAVELIRQYQEKETHPFLKAEFSIIAGEKNISISVPQEAVQTKKRYGTIRRCIFWKSR